MIELAGGSNYRGFELPEVNCTNIEPTPSHYMIEKDLVHG